MKKNLIVKVVILGALVQLFAASAWACGETSDIPEKKLTNTDGTPITAPTCHDAAGAAVDCSVAGAIKN